VCGFGTERYGKLWACDSADWYCVLVKVVRVSGTDRCCNEWACDSADCYSLLVKVNILRYFMCIA
jgi:hypothetical protein